MGDIVQSISSVANAINSTPAVQQDICKANGIDVSAYSEDTDTETMDSTTSDDVDTTTGTPTTDEGAEPAET